MFCSKCGTQLPDDATFCYKCGTRVGGGAQAAAPAKPSAPVIASPTATQMKCPSCGAPLSPKFGEMIITCEYCGSSVALGGEGWTSIQNHTMLPVQVSKQDDVTERVHGMMDKGFFHRHLQEESTLEEMNLTLVPYWLVPVSARTSIVAVDMAAEAGSIATTAVLAGMLGGAMSGGGRRGFGGGAVMDGMLLGTMMGGGMRGQGTKKTYELDNNYNFPVIGLKALTEYQPNDYQFNLGQRVLFDATKVKGIKVLNGDIGEEVAKSQGKTLVDQLQSQRAHDKYHMIQQMRTESDVGDPELLHAPIWFARYDHKGKKIVLVIDGNSGGFINVIGL